MTKTYRAEIESYWKKRNNYRKDNYLKLTGLLKLNDSVVFFGLKDSLTPVINAPMEDTIGKILVYNDSLVFESFNQQLVSTENDSIITETTYKLDKYGNSEHLYYKNTYWQIITRSNRKFIRVWNKNHPASKTINGYKTFPPNLDFIFKASLNYYDEYKNENVKSQLGIPSNQTFIGKLTFNYEGNSYSLDVGEGGFLMVGDETSGNETYGGGRYIDLELPKTNGEVILDFNKLYNPPCIFSDYTTCVYPPVQNYLPFEILAGETIHSLD